MQYHEFEMGITGTGHSTAVWRIDFHSEDDLRAIINVLVSGLFNNEDNELSNRYVTVKGKNGSIKWASKKISSSRPDVKTCKLPEPFTKS